MRVKVILALAIASVMLLWSAGVVLADDSVTSVAVPTSITGAPTAEQLTNAADQQCTACGFPDLSSIGDAVDSATGIPADTIDALTLSSPICGDCGIIPDSTCSECTNEIAGPQVNLGCPLINTYAVPVTLQVPAVQAEFAPIDVAPQVCLGLPQVNLEGVCNDIQCPCVTNINSCPVCGKVDC